MQIDFYTKGREYIRLNNYESKLEETLRKEANILITTRQDYNKFNDDVAKHLFEYTKGKLDELISSYSLKNVSDLTIKQLDEALELTNKDDS
ncbi:MAG: hypothetical protein ACMXX9_04255 [Candidatus Woesearchaeota archaeon]